jgi:hypothetical protein
MKFKLKLPALHTAGWGDTEIGTAAAVVKTTVNNTASNVQCGLPVSYREALNAATKQP